ncbi:MAG TPA: ATP-dependent zinc metalloprotease FtsH [Luteibaculaceae bacterium]|nr:ATP-dependent zinc metalloprotease FtsH [Luteibaculaceae bacterium]
MTDQDKSQQAADNNQFEKVKQKFTKKNKKNGQDPNPGEGPGGFNFYWIYAAVAVIILANLFFNNTSSMLQTTYGDFQKMVAGNEVEKVIVFNEKTAEVWLKKDVARSDKYKNKLKQPWVGGVSSGPHLYFNLPAGKEGFSNYLNQASNDKQIKVDYQTRENWGREIFGWMIFLVIIVSLWMFMLRRVGGGGGAGGQIFNIGRSKAQIIEKGKGTNITFNDVAGLEGAKEEIQEIVDFLKNPKKYTELGAKIPKGALLVGPPGTGKTLLAKAVAGEAKVPFFSLSGSDFVEMFVGVGASRVRDLFRQAKEKAPCIIFIDEIDAVGRARSKNLNFGSNDERENTLNQLLTEMDGFGTNSGVIILAATNRADILDRALLRAGRFDRQIYVDMPDVKERKAIFGVHLKPLKLEPNLDIDFLARQTPGFSGADIANICNEAALIAARKKKSMVEKQDFLDAVDRIIGGLEKKNKIITPREKETIAYHEAGHATVSWLVEHASPLVKVTIVPRGQSLGAAWYLPEERQINTTEQILDEMCAALGGRAAEAVIFNQISTGALSDLEKVTKQAYAMVKVFGLNDKIGNVSYYDSRGAESFQNPYSEATAQVIDEEVSKIIEGQFERAKNILTENREKLDRLAKKLLEKEVIFKEDLEDIFGKSNFHKDEVQLIHQNDEEVKVLEENTPEQAPEQENG